MGATEWSYFSPYQPDILSALRQLQADVFARGEYERPQIELDPLEAMSFFSANEPDRQEILSWYFMEALRAFMAREGSAGLREKLLTLSNAPTLASLEDLKVLMELSSSGTGSILDLGENIFPTRGKSGLYPLPPEQQRTLWRTERPTRQDIERWQLRLPRVDETSFYRRGEGFFVTVYKDGRPDEIYFEGASGD